MHRLLSRKLTGAFSPVRELGLSPFSLSLHDNNTLHTTKFEYLSLSPVVHQVMSLNSAMSPTNGEESVGSGATVASLPRLCAASGQGGVHYAAWRPQMETFLMRAGIEARDYKKEIPMWKELD